MTIQEMLSQIHASGMSDYAIGREIGKPQSMVHRLRSGKHQDSMYETGKAIERLYDFLFPEKRLAA